MPAVEGVSRPAGRWPARSLGPALLAFLFLFARDAPAHRSAQPGSGTDTPMPAAPRDVRWVSWAEGLAPLEVTSAATGASATIRLYGMDGELDQLERARLENVVAVDGQQHILAARLEQLVVKAAHHFGDAPRWDAHE